MIITEEIRNALKQAISIVGNPYQLSKRLEGIRHTTIRDWISGKTKSISDENWEIVRDIVGDILNEERIPAPWGRDYDLSTTALTQKNVIDTYDIAAKLGCLSAIERNRLFICLSHIEALKKDHPEDEIEFSFSAKVAQSTNNDQIGCTCDDDDPPANLIIRLEDH